jgi:hypothetical protein
MPSTSSTRATARDELVRLGIAPRGLPLDLAAAYVGLSPHLFLLDVERGRYPQPIKHGAKDKIRRWDRAALDDAMDKLNGRVPASPASTVDPIMAKIHAAKAAAKV